MPTRHQTQTDPQTLDLAAELLQQLHPRQDRALVLVLDAWINRHAQPHQPAAAPAAGRVTA